VKFFVDNGMVFGSEQIGEISLKDASMGFMHGRSLDRVPGERIPLWQLVFHDACLVQQAYATPRTDDNKKRYDKHLEEMLYGSCINSGVWGDKDGATEMLDMLDNSLHVDQWHEQVAMDEMVSHKFLTDDYLIEETEFSSGKKIISTFNNKEKTVDGKKIKANDYLIIS